MANTEGLDQRFWSRLEQMIRDSGGRMYVVSGYRSVEEQTALWNDALSKYGSADAARQWVAPPGKSNHNHGWAVDLGYTDGGLEWAHSNAYRYGLHFPMEWEPWHIEPTWARDGSASPPMDEHIHEGMENAGPYTDPPTGFMSVDDPARNGDLATQLMRIVAMVENPVESNQVEITRPEMYS